MARDHSGKRLAPHVFEAVSWEAMKAAIFEHCAPHIQNRASYVDDPRVWTVSENAPTNEDFENFITIKMGRNAFRPTSSALAHRYLSDHVNQRFIIVVFKWGNQIVNSNDLQQFHEQCVQVPVRDRSGAAAESLHQATVAQLKEKWSRTYRAYEATWRMWASTILKKPLHMHTHLISLPPPSNILQLFDRVGDGAEERLQQVQRNLILSNDVVESCLADLESYREATSDLLRRIEVGIERMKSKKRIIDAVLVDVHASITASSLSAAHLIPNIEDIDHADESFDSD
ncbi:hypothetical protein Ae201684P_003753 [Aphanomyces euteiches]|nr:hypothetical protein Ae201684P_003753 [Aphanomyces euteiches]KAH9143724.1 hypothetical protein AeRB84_012298 [Aphanomyces euteiches]